MSAEQARVLCEIEDCGRRALVGTTNGIHVCERCRIEFVSIGAGAVFFAGRHHGVIGASYTDEQRAVFPGLAAEMARHEAGSL